MTLSAPGSSLFISVGQQFILLSQKRRQVLPQVFALRHDGPPHSDEMRRLVSPGRFGLVDQKRVPKNLIAVQVVGMFTEPRADYLLFVPKVYDSGIGEKRGRPFVSRVARIHIEPDRIDLQFRRGVLRQDFALRPPGAGHADRSGRREQQNQARRALVLVKEFLQLFQALQILQRRVGRRRSGLRA